MKNLDFEKVYNNLSKDYYVKIAVDLEKTIVNKAISSFFKFLEIDDKIKDIIKFKIDPNHRRGEIGFYNRKAEDDIYNDNKSFFHFHPKIFELYPDLLAQNDIVKEFMVNANIIWQLAYKTIKDTLEILDFKFPQTSNKVFNTQNPHIILRFLKYEWSESGKYLAKPHFDSGSYTLAIAESCQGLRIGSKPEDLQIVENEENKVIFFLSSNHIKSFQDQNLKPAWHDVVQLDESMIGKPFVRWAIVAFTEPQGVDALPRTETHKFYKPN